MKSETINLDEVRAALESDEPYFGNEVMGLQSRLVRYGHMRDLVRWICSSRQANEPLSVLEIGSWIGASALTWGAAINDFNEGQGVVACIDPWEEYRRYRKTDVPPDDRMNALFRADLPFKLFCHNVSTSGLTDIVIPIRSTGKKVLSEIEDQSLDIVYLDGDRLFENIMADIELSKPKIKIGGFIVGDDLAARVDEVDDSEMRIAIENNIEMFQDSKSQKIYLPGLTLAVETCFGTINDKQGFWFAQRSEAGWEQFDFPTSGALPEHIAYWSSKFDNR